ncbi:MAG: glutathione S-transferase [Pseudomonadota bacterium]
MELLYSPASPFVRMALITAHETGLIDAMTLTAVSTTMLDTDPRVAAANPTGRIPTLLREDGPALCDSRVICRYLNFVAGADLYPAAREWEVLTLEALAQGMTDSAVAMVYERRLRPEAAQYAPVIEGHWDKVARTLDAIEGRWMSHLHGPLDCGQIAVAACLGYLDFRHGDRDWRTTRPSLAAWYGKMAERPSLKATQPDG